MESYIGNINLGIDHSVKKYLHFTDINKKFISPATNLFHVVSCGFDKDYNNHEIFKFVDYSDLKEVG